MPVLPIEENILEEYTPSTIILLGSASSKSSTPPWPKEKYEYFGHTMYFQKFKHKQKNSILDESRQFHQNC
ncbi:hypothetical protein NQ315_000714 [Exocentrus adspersus]|uniref:Uncharacterized protein n=1 Tax=Exocentrus adspersus TaxID=1586481 RepID=A0AAV8WCZ7_9CUCU|nr:hypothetical protein NQ315_000714 [Exocentrus adspersus]